MTRQTPYWFLPGFSLLLGLCCLAAFGAGGNLGQGLFSLAVLGGFGLVFLLGGRSELIRGLRGDGRDEYWKSIDEGATLLAGLVLIVVVVAMCLWEWAHGRDGRPYTQLAAIGGVAYVLALAGLRLRR